MVDRQARNQLAEALRALASGLITNDKFEDRVPRGSKDPAVWSIFTDGAWLLYSDLKEYRLKGKNALSPEVKHHIARWVLFLRTDKPYEWPRFSRFQTFVFLLLGLATLGLSTRLFRKRYSKRGDIEVWPFICVPDYEEALHAPAYLRG